ncbi:anti-sigma factor [Streptomyces anulatus]|uniref:anti-sigma factor n=1 Tax=Streptomyces anulatus TaxID=1892 RepID=UPI0004CA2D16|nr:zf-HC2 domain-containing protein [Streptomyces anulatus]
MSDQQWQPWGPRPPGHHTPSGPSSTPYAAGPAHPSGPAHHSGPGHPGGPSGRGEPFGVPPEGPEHDAAAAYVLGILDDAQASAFETHLAGCARCAAHLDEFATMEPMLAMLSEAPAAAPGARPVPHVPERPAPRLLGGLMDEVARKRHRRTRRSRYLVAAAAALIIGGPVAAFAVTAGDDRGGGPVAAGDPHPTSPAEDAFFQHMTEKVSATDPTTQVGATVGMEEKAWGTHTVLELKNVKGPQKCNLVAVSKTGEEEVVTSWSVPRWGYGIEGATNPTAKSPLYVHGGAAMDRKDIDRFEVRTFDGERLVEIGA